MKKIVFFTMNDFRKEGGGTIRMLGIINELAKIHTDITLISNLEDHSKIAENVKTIALNTKFTPEDKRKFQFLLGVFGYKKLNKEFPQLLGELKRKFSAFDEQTKIVFFEYLDNSIGYWLKKNKVISGYIDDIHGIASNEFDFQARKANSLKAKLLFRLKGKISQKVDRKVFENADGIIYASAAMDEYFKKLYPSLTNKKNYYLPYVLNNSNIKASQESIVEKFKKELHLNAGNFVFLFAGAYKETGGIQDLIIAFDHVASEFPNSRLILVGDGPTFDDCKKIHNAAVNSDKIFMLGRQPYDYLSSFQELANVLVCPDRQNLFSDLIVHVKYLDALVSGKLVINGSFKSVVEINQNKELSLLFKPSDIEDLKLKMKETIINVELLNKKFAFSKDYTLENLTYTNFIKNLI